MILFYIQVYLDKCHIMAKSKLRAFLQNRCILSFTQNIETMLWKGGDKSILSLSEEWSVSGRGKIPWYGELSLSTWGPINWIHLSLPAQPHTRTLDGQFAAHLHWAYNLPSVQNTCTGNQSQFPTQPRRDPKLSFSGLSIVHFGLLNDSNQVNFQSPWICQLVAF